nr:MAG TPA: hypothetical protein [Bacteriophage sp.]DAQ62367.1 MAG TPA: hypothetical protein [Caudoviricetes sp.]
MSPSTSPDGDFLCPEPARSSRGSTGAGPNERSFL